MSPLVERVTNSFPQVQRTVASAYSGWISVFMALTRIVASTRGGERVVLLVGLVDLRARIGDRLQLLAGRARLPRNHHGGGRARRQPGDRAGARGHAGAQEIDVEDVGRAASPVDDDGDVALRPIAQLAHGQVGARVRLAARARG